MKTEQRYKVKPTGGSFWIYDVNLKATIGHEIAFRSDAENICNWLNLSYTHNNLQWK